MLKQLESIVKQQTKKHIREAKKTERKKEGRERDRMAAEEADSRAAWQVSVLYSRILKLQPGAQVVRRVKYHQLVSSLALACCVAILCFVNSVAVQ